MEGKVEGLDEACEVSLLLIVNLYLGQDFASLCMISWVSLCSIDALQGCRCVPQLKAVYLLLALYREITTLYGHDNEGFHPTPQVHS